MKLLFFAVFCFVPVICNDVFMSKTSDLHIVRDDLEVLVPMPDRLGRWIDDLGFFQVVVDTGSNPLRAHVTCCRRIEYQFFSIACAQGRRFFLKKSVCLNVVRG